jgi:hypothetical protein
MNLGSKVTLALVVINFTILGHHSIPDVTQIRADAKQLIYESNASHYNPTCSSRSVNSSSPNVSNDEPKKTISRTSANNNEGMISNQSN